MGNRTRLRREFLKKHPICCFCGGTKRSTTEDHVPSRAMFDNRQWPEGFNFPACDSCNSSTRHDEQIVAMLSIIYPDASTDAQKQQVEERMSAVAHNYPEVIEEMQLSEEQLKSFLRKHKVSLPEGTSTSDVPLLSLKGRRLNQAVESFGRKLFSALHYKHTNQIIPQEGGIALIWYSNIQIKDQEIPQEFAKVLNRFPTIIRCNTSLHEQFFYRFGISANKETAAYLVFFRESFAMLGWVRMDADKFDIPQDSTVLHPLKPSG